MCVLSLFSCRTIKTAHNAVSRDTLIVKEYEYRLDSVYIDRYHNVYVKGDTVFKTDSIVNNVMRYVNTTDTLYRSEKDTVFDTIEKVVRERSSYDKSMSIGFWTLLALIILYVAIRILIRIYLRR